MALSRLALGFGLALLLALAGCKRAENAAAPALLFPTLASQQGDLDRLQLRGAGDVALVTIVRKQGVWRLAERGDWPADAGLLSQYLFVLSQAHKAEAKTSNPALYARLGVEPITGAKAGGSELRLSGKSLDLRLLIGHEHPNFDANYVRVDGEAQSWLTDLPVSFDRDPVAWLDHSLLEIPLARIALVDAHDGSKPAFSLSHRDDRFRLDDAPSAAMRDSFQGDALAGALGQLRFEDVADDDGGATPERVLRFTTVDGLVIELQAWHEGDRLWLRLRESLDESRAKAWAAQSGKVADLAALGRRVADDNQRFAARRFLMPAEVAALLLLTHEQILAGAPKP